VEWLPPDDGQRVNESELSGDHDSTLYPTAALNPLDFNSRPPTAFEQATFDSMSVAAHEQVFRDILTEIRAKNDFSTPSTLLICSTSESPHSADLLIRLAMLIAESDEDVLVIDANLGEQTLTRNFVALSKPGLCDVAAGHVEPMSILLPTANRRIQFAPCGDDLLGISRDPIQIEMDRLSRAVEQWQHHYHRILIDVGSVDSSLLEPLGKLCEAVTTLMPYPQPSESEIREASQKLNALPGKHLGWILSGFPNKQCE
jgi:hypothetical protein